MQTELEHRLRCLIEKSGISEVGVGFHEFRTGTGFLVEGHRAFHAASMMKVPVMCEAFRQAAQGKLGLDDTIPIVNEFTSIVDGSRFAMDPEDDANKSLYEKVGGEESVHQLVELMVTESGNLATNILVDRLGIESIAEFMEELGAPGMVVVRGVCDEKAFAQGLNSTATAAAYLALILALAEGRVVSREASDEMIRVLLRQKHNEGIPAGLPAETPVAHKTGWNTDYYHDGGLILKGREPAFALAVFTKGAKTIEDAHRLVASVAVACRQATETLG